ncbi:MAG: histidine kinase dimerization/phospho-acceptor domain-containing protein, partial [Candidatus Rokuibacteriota bacterium]
MTTDRASLAHLRHELRTPLNHIIGYSEMLLEDVEAGGPAGLALHLRGIHENAIQVLGLVNAFLAPGRIEAGEVDIGRMPAELSAPLDAIVASGETLKARATEADARELLPDLERIVGAAQD